MMISKELAPDWRSCPFSSLPTCTRPTTDVECFNGRKIFARGLQSPYTELSVHQTRIKSQYTHVHNLRIQHRLYAEHADRPYKTDTSSSRCSRIGGSHIKELERRGRGENWKNNCLALCSTLILTPQLLFVQPISICHLPASDYINIHYPRPIRNEPNV